jgi:DNA polymerase/3'-5' exonuclease PolX
MSTKKRNYKNVSRTKSKIKSKTINHNNTNTKIINILSIVKNYYEKEKDTIHVNAYERAIYQIKHWQKPITKGNDLKNLVGIGKGMIEKIDTIIETGTLPIIKEKGLEINLDTINKKTKKQNSNSNLNSNLNHILGFGEKFIKELKTKYNARTINEIRKIVKQGKIKLNNTQSIGLKYYEDLNTPIPRQEITEIGTQLKDSIEKSNKFLRCFIAGSYPSGTKEFSKDIDLLIVINENVTHNLGMFKSIIKQIESIMSLETISLGNEKFLGIIKSPSSHKWRHLDIRITLIDEMPYAWLYYTGGKIFNKLIRERIKKKGYKLNEYGLFKSNNGSRVELEKEKKENNNNDSDNYNDLDKFGINKDGMININEKEMMQYIVKIEKKIFKLADLEYKSVMDRY